MTFAQYTQVQVDPSDNCAMSAHQVYKNLGPPVPVVQVRIFEGEPEGVLYAVTGWSSEDGGSPVPAYAVQVEDSSEGWAYVVFGGDYGLRLRPANSTEAWGLDVADQFGETHLVLADREDLIEA